MTYSGQGKKQILVITEKPTEEEDFGGVFFQGEENNLIERHLADFNIDFEEDCWKTTAVNCFTEDKITEDQINACRPNLIKIIETLNPILILVFGSTAAVSLLNWISNDSLDRNMEKLASWLIPAQKPNAWIGITHDPEYIIRTRHFSSVSEILFHNHLAKFVCKTTRPWTKLPDYSKQIELIYDTNKAAHAIRLLSKETEMAAFDYEGNCLKPERPKAEIVSCSICFDGKKTIAFPFKNTAIEATKEFLVSPIAKIAANLKFEDRWTKKILAIRVANWYWDTMLAAHRINNAKGVCGLKFQAFVLLGQPAYNLHIEPLLEDEDENGYNRIREISLSDLLYYNALDSLLEFKLAKRQIKIIHTPRRPIGLINDYTDN